MCFQYFFLHLNNTYHHFYITFYRLVLTFMEVCVSLCRCLQEEHQLRPASLPAIPNPFPELCSPAGSPVMSPTQTSDNHVRTPCLFTYTYTELHFWVLIWEK